MKIMNFGSACFLVEIGGIKILTDPWLKGKGFIDGWSPLFQVDDLSALSDVDYVWFSHEHPDHFNPASILHLQAFWQSFPTVIFQNAFNKRVVDYIKNKIGARVIEVNSGSDIYLKGGIKGRIVDTGIYDSFIQVCDEQFCFTHLNDCAVYGEKALQKIKAYAGDRIHTMTSQYGLASSPCSSHDQAGLEYFMNKKIEQYLIQNRIVNPDIAIPSSSAIHFCSKDNLWLNKYRVNPAILVDPIEKMGIRCVLPLFGATIDIAQITNEEISAINEEADTKFKRRLNETARQALSEQETSVSLAEIQASVHLRSKEIKKNNNPVFLYMVKKVLNLLHPQYYFLTDDRRYLIIDPVSASVDEVTGDTPQDYVSIHSHVLNQLYNSPYGIDALIASGRFDLHGSESIAHFNNHLNLQSLNLAGLNLSFLTMIQPKVVAKMYRILMQWWDFRNTVASQGDKRQ